MTMEQAVQCTPPSRTGRRLLWLYLYAAVMSLGATAAVARAGDAQDTRSVWKRIAPYFSPPPELANDFGPYRSPLKFDDGTDVKTPGDWQRRRQEILAYWHK